MKTQILRTTISLIVLLTLLILNALFLYHFIVGARPACSFDPLLLVLELLGIPAFVIMFCNLLYLIFGKKSL